MVNNMKRRGFSLVEVLVGTAILGAAGLAMLSMLSGGVEGTARAGEVQLASMMGARIVDRVVATGYATLATRVGRGSDLELAKIGEPGDGAVGDAKLLVVDGIAFSGTYAIEKVDAGLLRVTVALTWQKHGAPGNRAPGSLTLMRYVADPAAGMSVREAFGGTRA